MKGFKNFISVLLSIIGCICFAIGLSACSNGNNTESTQDKDILAIYNMYVAYAEENNTTPLSYSDWLLTIKGEKGDKGEQGIQGEKGEKGEQGLAGINGTNGTNGKDGVDGINGKDGADGQNGLGIKNVAINDDGDLIITFDNDTTLNAGNVVNPNIKLNDNNKITFSTLEITENNVYYGKVSNETETFSFIKEINLIGNASYTVYTDLQGTTPIPTKTVSLEIGNNTFYILETCGNDSNLYTVTIRRKPIYTVSFVTNKDNISVKTQFIEEDSLAESPEIIQVDGYGTTWDYDFNTPITNNITVNATWNAIFKVESNSVKGLTDYGKTLSIINMPKNIDGQTITQIGSLSNCSLLTSITLPESITNISNYAFMNCSNLKSITIPNNVTCIHYGTFRGCNSLTKITLPDNITTISDSAFYECSNLTSITIPDKVTSIGSSAFYKCSSLTSVTIPDSVNSIDDKAFSYCSSLSSITVDDNNTKYKSIDGNLYNKDGTTLIQFAIGKTTTEFIIPDGVTKIITSAFNGCTTLSNITIPSGVTNIYEYTFSSCSSLTSLTIPASVTNIGNFAFNNCNNLTNVYYTGTIDEWVQISFYSNWYSNPLYYAKNLYINNKLVTKANITSATKINNYAFHRYHSLTSVTIGNSVTSIGYSAFDGCKNLTEITIPDSITSISNSFNDCNNLKSVYYTGSIDSWVQIEGIDKLMRYGKSSKNLYINGKLLTEANITTATKINDCAFYNCSSLTSVTIPNSVTSIGDTPFLCCINLTNINYSGTKDEWEAIQKNYDWNNYSYIKTITCTDGTITL